MKLIAPWLVEGRSEIGGATDKQILNRLAQDLSDQYKAGQWHPDGTMTFDDPSLLGPNWPALAVFSRGRMWIERDAQGAWLRYRLGCLPLFIFASFASILAATFLGWVGDPLFGLKAGGFLFAILYVLNLVTGLARASHFFDKVAREAGPAL